MRHLRILLLLSAFAAGALAEGDSDEKPLNERVVILANANDPESLKVAEYYAARRHIPKANIVAFPVTSSQTFRWPDFIQSLYEPLQRELIQRGWIDAITSEVKDKTGRTRLSVAGHRISYLVVCRGVPLRIEHDRALYRPVRPITDRREFQTNAGAVDAELSLLAAGNYPISGVVPNPLFQKDRPTVFEEARVIKVSRLDGPTVEDVFHLIDSALAAESQGLIGRAYVDIGGPHARGDEWFRDVAKQLEATSYEVVVNREKATFRAADRFDAPALYFGWYAANLDGAFLEKDFAFPPGAIALHLHSYSATSVHTTESGWVGPLVSRGVTATVGNVYEPYLDFTHQPQLLARALLRGDRWGDAIYYALRGLSWQGVAIGDPLYRPLARPFAEQWQGRHDLPDALYPYVVLREVRRLERAGAVDAALKVAREEMERRPSVVLAVGALQLNLAHHQRDQARRVGEWLVAQPVLEGSALPVLAEAARALKGSDFGELSLQLHELVLRNPATSPALRRALIEGALALAKTFDRADLLALWTETSPPTGKETGLDAALPGHKKAQP